MFSFFDMRAINALTQQLINDFIAAYPDPAVKNSKDAGRAIATVEKQVLQFVATKPRLGIYRKAKCANAVKWALQNGGYPQETVDEVVKRILYGLSDKIKPTTPQSAPAAAPAPEQAAIPASKAARPAKSPTRKKK
ncbi:hypothetical protein IGB42_04024 [Andreprevotia sp. IGB-42]|uniref:hypothetical protein n=1 Tax=Andreprevotia sp. IGB-42 TaxID=2497473 RepID=UPI0013591D6E|nr:hypothetical protein [Andreprevotia sp. IGB-42]KAF0811493.1 hypothetical protein IGB42_04024 [Andreprevotia sp. IGB-42]